jgi:hypothetical protein
MTQTRKTRMRTWMEEPRPSNIYINAGVVSANKMERREGKRKNEWD